MADKGKALNDRIWDLFERAGFETNPNSNSAAEHEVRIRGRRRTVDLYARALGISLVGWNKARTSLKESFTTHVNDWVAIRAAAKADTVLFVSSERDFSRDDADYAKAHGMVTWGLTQLEYYEAVVDAIGKYAQYEIIHALGLETSEEKRLCNVLALKLNQPFGNSPVSLFLFSTTPEVLLKTCVVLRRAQGSADTYQRILQKKRLGGVRKFLTTPNALLPPNIIVSLSDGVHWQALETPQNVGSRKITLTRKKECELGILTIPLEYASLELIDGQHRLFGFTQTEPGTIQNFNLVVTGLQGISKQKRTDTFVAINDNARRMDPNLVAYLKYTEDEAECQRDNELMAIKIAVHLNQQTPFKNAIRLLDTGNQRITLKGLVGYDLKGLIGERGLLRKHYPNTSGDYISVLRMYFGVLKSTFPTAWSDPDKYIVATNRGISAFLKLLRSLVRSVEGKVTERDVKMHLNALRRALPDKEWEISRLKNKYVGSAGWKQFHSDLVSAIRETYPDFDK